MKRFIAFSIVLIVLTGCTKEVEIDIPGYQDQIVIDGQIETDAPPFVLISTSKDIYAKTDLEAFLSGFISGAKVTVSDGTNTVLLDEVCSDNLPPGTEQYAAAIFGVPVEELENYHLCVYTTFNMDIWGQVGKTYNLTVEVDGKTYTSSTTLPQPTPLDKVFWKADEGYTDRGYSWATLSDPAGQFDAYKWEIMQTNKDQNGTPVNSNYIETYSPVFNDDFFDGLTFDFFYENPNAYGPGVPEDQRSYYMLGDTVIIKFSKMDEAVYEFLEKKYVQLATAGNPFATPTNIPSNIDGGALGLWAGFSPSYDTLICVP